MTAGQCQVLAHEHVTIAKRLREEANRASTLTAQSLRHAARYHEEAAARYAEDARIANAT